MYSFIFISVHQTATTIREELFALTDCNDDDVPNLSYDVLRRTTFLDSFIREVLRLKGDTLSLIRGTTRDIPLAAYTIPKGKLHRVSNQPSRS